MLILASRESVEEHKNPSGKEMLILAFLFVERHARARRRGKKSEEEEFESGVFGWPSLWIIAKDTSG